MNIPAREYLVLEHRGYVTLTQNEQDNRNLSVALTERILDFFERFGQKGEVFLTQLFNGTTEQQLEVSRAVFETLFENTERMEQTNV